MSDKPVIFISHSSKDDVLARLIKQQIEVCIDDIEVFASDIDPGENWFDKVMRKLQVADAIVVLITPNSVAYSHWVWFELGYFWAIHDNALTDASEKERICFPIYEPSVTWPKPVKDLQIQATNLKEKDQIQSFFKALIRRFSGNYLLIDFDQIIATATQVCDIRAYDPAPADNDQALNEPGNYSYGDWLEILVDKLSEDYWRHIQMREVDTPDFETIFGGKLFAYSAIDMEYGLPNGTAELVIEEAMLAFNYIPHYMSESFVRFKRAPKEYDGGIQDSQSMDDTPF